MGGAADLVCIIDDDSSVRNALGRMIRSNGFSTAVFASADEFLKFSDIDRAACLIIDVVMPDMNGLDLCDALQTSGRSIPAIFVSAYETATFRERAQSLGAVSFLQKPCDESLLVNNIVSAFTLGATPAPTGSFN
jgi:FixJ family two-component response regulator